MNFNNDRFLKSALSVKNCLNSLSEILEWIKTQNDLVEVKVNRTTFSELSKWHLDANSLRHESGNFFSIMGIDVKTNSGMVGHWTQPIINQPEIGYLGFIVKEFEGVIHFLMQAKIEPGNVNNVQLSPTLQATKSNYTRIHKGKSPDYLSYFQNAPQRNILLDQLQSEQGGRFLKKRNRNIIIQVEDEIELKQNFIWVTLGQIKHLMCHDNVVNMDSRTVVSGIPYANLSESQLEEIADQFSLNAISRSLLSSYTVDNYFKNSFTDILSFITDLKCKVELNVNTIPLSKLNDWIITDREIHQSEHKYFSVIGAEIEISSREVTKWHQPLVKPAQEGICAFICKEIKGTLHFIVQAKVECGNFDMIELAPTVQCLTGNYNNKNSISELPYLEYILNVDSSKVIFDTYQSEEGGRFYREQNRNLIVKCDDEISNELPDNYIWMTLNQLQTFVQFNNYINIQARSLISAIPFNS